jgi:hypothetical protein
MSKYVKESNIAQNEIKNFKYDLYGVINHLGQSLYLGHYTSFARTHEKLDSTKDELGWRLFDDSKSISIKNKEQIVTRDAYVLLYRLQPAANDSTYNAQQPQADNNETKASSSSAVTNEILEASEDENSDINSDESEQFNSANQSSDDNCDNNDKFRSKYTNLNDID